MAGPINFIVDLTLSKDEWTIKVRVIRLWKQPNFLQPELGDNVELVLLDENGGRIQASARGTFRIKDHLVEGDVYEFSNFGVALNTQIYKPIRHVYKLTFNLRTALTLVPTSTIPMSHLWDYCKVLTLTKNMRLQTGSFDQNLNDIREFSEWLLKIGNGDVGEDFDGEATIEVPEEMLIKDQENGFAKLVEFVYSNFLENSTDPNFFQECSILSHTLIDVAMLNEYLMSFIPGDERTYLSSDTICKEDANFENEEDTFSPDILNTFTAFELPNHKLNFKVGVPVMLLRNIDQSNGLCNGTRLLITKLGNHVIEAKILSSNNIDQIVLIPRMTTMPSSHTLPVKFKRRQFPLVRCFAMTINKSQGQTLSHVGIHLPRPVFSHGQLYVALSRVKSKQGPKIIIIDDAGQISNKTTNMVFKEVFHRLT